MAREIDLEQRLRVAFGAEAARTAPHSCAWAENMRRLRGTGRRRRFLGRFLAIPATAAATAAVIMLAFTVHPEHGGRRQGPDRPVAAALPADLDPKYRPAGTPVASTDGRPMAWWFAGRGANTLLCWRLVTGGGDCRGWPAPPHGRHAAYVGTADLGPAARGGSLRLVMTYGVTDGRSGPVTATLPSGTRHTGDAITVPGRPWRIWRIVYAREMGDLTRDAESTVVSDAQGALPGKPARQVYPLLSPRPLTTGVPAFSYRAAGQTVTMHVFVDGTCLQLGHGGALPAVPGRGKYFGSVRRVDKSIDHPWIYGFLSPRMAAVALRLADGRTVPARIVRAGPYRVFAVELVDERPGDRGGHDLILSYDAAGKPLASRRA
ncbi:MAG TPA: hypothetical protein VF069_26385 [Streptosporangiaceae bacterium]